ncbi:PhoH family protein [Salana multivorans]
MTTPVGGGHIVHQLELAEGVDPRALLGPRDEVLRAVERGFPSVVVHARDRVVTLEGPRAEVELAARLLEELSQISMAAQPLSADAVDRAIAMLRSPAATSPASVMTTNILSARGKTIRPKTVGQKEYVEAIDRNTVTFGIGPAGTGKTYLAMAKAVQALQNKEVSRLLLTRPAVEAGERLGFLPGTLTEKIDPYLRPLYDALHDMVDPDSIPRLMASGTIEVAPLAYMRGRAQPVDTPVLTPDGFRPIGSLRVGDLVVGADGRPTTVLGVYPQGVKDVYRVTAQDGASTRACAEHLWHVFTHADRRRSTGGRVLQTADMIGSLRAAHAHRYELPVVEPVELPEQAVPMDPYALGLLLGDGCITTATTPSFSTGDTELVAALDRALVGVTPRATSEYDYVLRRTGPRRGGMTNPVTAVLRELGLAGTRSHTKFIPEVYLHNSVAVRVAVLQGLLDTDGGPVTQARRTCRIQYVTCSDRLRDDVVHLVRSLGGVAYVRTRSALGRTPGRAWGRPVPYRHDAHVLDIRLPRSIRPFRLARKAERYERDGGGRPMRFIHSIEPDGRAECVCIAVSAADSLYVTEDFLVTHNTINDAFIVLDEAQNTTPEQMKMFLTRLGFGSKMVVTGDVTQVDLPGGTRSGLRVVSEILDGIDDIAFCRLTSADVVRHRLVGEIIDAYARWDDDEEPRRERSERSGRTDRADRRRQPRRREEG